MRIPDRTTSDTLVAHLQKLTGNQAQLNNQVSSGQRITKPSDDPAAVGRVLNYQAEKLRIQQFATNTDRAQSVSESSYTAVDQLKKISDRAGELGILAVGATDPTAQKAYATELNQLIEQGLQINNTSYSGQFIFGGTKTEQPPFTAARDSSGKITSVTYGGAATGAQIRVAEDATISAHTDGATNQQFGDFINNLVTLRDALQTSDPVAAQAAQASLHTSEDHLLVAVSNIGATQTRLEAGRTQNEARFSELEKQTAAETDVDLAPTLVKLTQAQTAYQATLQAGSQMLQLSLLDYVR